MSCAELQNTLAELATVASVNFTTPISNSESGLRPKELLILSRPWASHKILSNIVAILASGLFGHDVSFVSENVDATMGVEYVDRGYDIDVESWSPHEQYNSPHEHALGRTGFTGQSGIYTPTYVNEKHSDLALDWYKNHKFLNATALTDVFPGVEILHESDVAYASDLSRAESLVTNYELPYAVRAISSADKLSTIADAASRNEGVLFYHWQPDPLLSEFSLDRVHFPPHHVGCSSLYETIQDDGDTNVKITNINTTCDFPRVDPLISVSRDSMQFFPELYALLQSLSAGFTHDPQSEHFHTPTWSQEVIQDLIEQFQIAQRDSAGQDDDDTIAQSVACTWIADNLDLVKSRVPTCPVDVETLQCVCDSDVFDAQSGTCLTQPSTLNSAMKVLSNLKWTVMPVVDPPFVIRTGKPERPFSGFVIDVWERLAVRGQIDFEYVDPLERNLSGSYGAVFDAVVKYRMADMTLGAHFLTPERGGISAHSSSFVDGGSSFISHASQKTLWERMMTVITPFTADLWAVLFALFFVTAVVFWFIDRDGGEKSFGYHFYYVLVGWTNLDFITPGGFFSAMLAVLFAFFSMVLIALYTAMLVIRFAESIRGAELTSVSQASNGICILENSAFELKKNLVNKIFGYLARCEFWLKLGLRFWIFVGYVEILAKFGAKSNFRV